MRIEFIAATLADLEKQVRDFLGEPPVQHLQIVTATDTNFPPVPDWTPPGTVWQKSVGAPFLVTPNGEPVSFIWTENGPRPHTWPALPTTEAGAALLESIRGD